MGATTNFMHVQESRRFFAFAELNAGALSLTGTADNDWFTGGVVQRGGIDTFSVTLRIFAPDHTIASKQTLEFPVSSITQINAELLAGKDILNFSGVSFMGVTVFGGAGADTISGSEAGDSIIGGLGSDYILSNGGADTVRGNGGLDDILGGDGRDRLYGNAGDDNLHGTGENDTIFGGDGNDALDGGTGRDYLYAEAGNDNIVGSPGQDFCLGGSGDDRFFEYDNYRDTLDGGAGADSAEGTLGPDVLVSVELTN